jgi:hypothetical protein
MGCAIGRRTSWSTGIPQGLPYLTGFVIACEIALEAADQGRLSHEAQHEKHSLSVMARFWVIGVSGRSGSLAVKRHWQARLHGAAA